MTHEGDGKKRTWKDWFWMALCCAPMVAVAVLIGLGYWSWR